MKFVNEQINQYQHARQVINNTGDTSDSAGLLIVPVSAINNHPVESLMN